MHTGSGSGSNMKYNTKVQKIKNERPTFWETMLLLALKRQVLKKNFVSQKLPNISGPKTETRTGT
jgi:hypothetical protein